MDKMTFGSYNFKPSDVIEGLNRYFAETKAYRYLRPSLEIKNGEVKPGNYYVLRNIVFVFVTDTPPRIYDGYYYLICDPEEVVGVAINWLREEHDIVYAPGMPVPNGDGFEAEIELLCSKNREAFWRKRALKAENDVKELSLKVEELEKACRRKDHLLSEQTKRLMMASKKKEALTDIYRTLRYPDHHRVRTLETMWDELDTPSVEAMRNYILMKLRENELNEEALKNEIKNLKDLINRIHEETDI